jgi:capsular exopolysaccharide synthesis family protein
MKNNSIVSRADIVWLISIVIKNWYLLLFLPLFSWVIAFFISYRIQEISAASCQILLKDESSFQSKFQETFNRTASPYSYEYTAGQMRVIKSSSIIESVLNELHLGVRYFIVGRLKVTEVYKHIPFKVLFDERAKASFGKRFNIQILDAKTFKLSYDVNGVNKENIFQIGQLITDDGLYLEIQFTNNKFYPSLQELNYQFQIYPSDNLISKYKSSISVTNLDYTSIIEVSLTDEIASRAVDFLESLSKYYLKTTIQNQIEVNHNTLEYIDNLLFEISGEVSKVEVELDSFKTKKNIIDIDREEVSLFERLGDLESQHRKLEMELSSLDELADYVFNSEDTGVLLPPSMFLRNIDEQILAQLTRLIDLKKNYQNGLEAGKPENPLQVSRSLEIGDLRNDILRYKSNQEKAIKQRIIEIKKEINTLETRIKFIPAKERQLLNIQKKISVNEGLYDYLLSRRAELLIAKAGLVPQTKIIEQPRSKGVIYPDKKSISFRAILFGFSLAIILITIREFFFRKVRTRIELEQLTKQTILGSVPFENGLDTNFKIDTAESKGSIIQAFRGLRASLQYLPKSSNCQKILVTSLMPGEGKTFVSTNLACVLALAGKRVLIVDLDMHKPRMHKVLGLELSPGASNLLSRGDDLEELIQKTHLDYLSALTAGPIPPNASELVLQEGINHLIEFAEKNYDYLIVDTPPTALIADSLLLMPKVDVKLFVCSSKSTSRTSVDYIERIIEDNQVKGAALILNREKRARLDYYYSRYGYGGYGYGYGGNGYGYKNQYGDDSNSLV